MVNRQTGEGHEMSVEVSEAAPGVFLAIGAHTNWCLVRERDAFTLVDAAWPKDYGFVVESLDRIAAGPDQVEAVVLTHAHPDHIGVAEHFRTEHDARVHVHDDETGYARGEYMERVSVTDLLMRIWKPSVMVFALNSFRRGGQHPQSVGELDSFSAGPLDVPGGLVAVPTPGHTSGHCSFHLPEVGAVVTGDALVNENVLTNDPGPRLMPRIFSQDWQLAAASLDQLAPLDADIIVPGHGTTMRMPVREAVEHAKLRLDDAGWWDR
jgi:glyoxylase-like metal-dependent hydrolase (beta-lactamase superfamily II)